MKKDQFPPARRRSRPRRMLSLFLCAILLGMCHVPASASAPEGSLADGAELTGKVALQQDVSLELSEGMRAHDLDLDLNGHVLTLRTERDDLTAITVERGFLRIHDSAGNGGVRMEGGAGLLLLRQGTEGEIQDGAFSASSLSDALVATEEGSLLTVRGGAFDGTDTSRLFRIGGRMDLASGTIRNGRAVSGGGIFLDGTATLLMTGGRIENCHASNPLNADDQYALGGGVCNNGGRMRMDGGAISGCSAAHGGGVHNTGRLTMTGGVVENCSARGCGGGFFLNRGSVSDFVPARAHAICIRGCDAGDRWGHGLASGGIFVEHADGGRSANCYLYNAAITGNTAKMGGGIGSCGVAYVNVGSRNGPAIWGNTSLEHAISTDIYCDGEDEVTADALGALNVDWEGIETKGGTTWDIIRWSEGSKTLNSFYLTAHVTDLQDSMLRDMAGTLIEGNTSLSGGGGVGGNGNIFLGGSAPDIPPIEKSPHKPEMPDEPAIVRTRVGSLVVEESDSPQPVADRIWLSGLAPGEKYTLAGHLYDTRNQSVVGMASKMFTPASSSCVEELEFHVPGSGRAGATFVVLVELRKDGEKIAAHKNLFDPDETVQVAAQNVRITTRATGR